ncbi:MAG TPA: hypothetical protein PLB91_08090 [Spirochaetales bacterium]|nr:hypothetical protein [Spirochaetales bacterium]HRY54111.1 hypothetical protein [Spirochaetia bacterium]HRZ64080.1 hypothetical protein [Spirochaetia bacterium]
MTTYEYYIVYPEGEEQEIPGKLGIDELVDLNGRPLGLPLPSARTIAYRVVKIRHQEERGIYSIRHYLELVPARELLRYLA